MSKATPIEQIQEFIRNSYHFRFDVTADEKTRSITIRVPGDEIGYVTLTYNADDSYGIMADMSGPNASFLRVLHSDAVNVDCRFANDLSKLVRETLFKRKFTSTQQFYRYLWFVVRFFIRLVDIPLSLVLLVFWAVFELFGKISDMFGFLAQEWNSLVYHVQHSAFHAIRRKFLGEK